MRVHNDDKLRRQKLKQQKAAGLGPYLAEEKMKSEVHRQETSEELDFSSLNLELKVAVSKLTVHEEAATINREPSHIRKAKASDLPPLEHVFAEGLYFTLADIVLLPCVHHFLVRFIWSAYITISSSLWNCLGLNPHSISYCHAPEQVTNICLHFLICKIEIIVPI